MEFTPAHIPFDQLDVSVADHDAPDGTLRAVVGLVPMGPEGNPYWSPAELQMAVSDLTDVCSLGAQVRQTFGALADLAGDPNQTLERMIAVTAGGVWILDPGQIDVDGHYAKKQVYTFSAVDNNRRCQFAQIGDVTFMAVSSGLGIGKPDELLLLVDDQVIPFDLPALPSMAVATTGSASPTAQEALERGTYQVRYAWRFRDGTTGPPSRPYLLHVGENDALPDPDTWRYRLTFSIDALTEAIPAYWTDLISGVDVFLSKRVDLARKYSDEAINTPVFNVATVAGVDVGAATSWSDTIEQIPTAYDALDDENLLHHQIRAAACYSYNKRLILGDVSYDYYTPQTEDFIVQPPEGTGTDYYLMLGFEIRTAGGTITRYTNPLGFSAAGAAAVEFVDGILAYCDRRAERCRFYVSTDYGTTAGGDVDAATWGELFTGAGVVGITRLRPGFGNFAYSSVVGITFDMTSPAAAVQLPVTSARSKKDHDVNRMLTSGVYQPFEILARRAAYVGNGPSDGIVGFASNALPISEGQFGDFPLYVLGQESVSMGRVGSGDVAWMGFDVVAKRGCVGRQAFTNIDQAIAFVSRDGVWMLYPSIDDAPLSAPLHYHNGATDFFGCLSYRVSCGFYNDKARGRRELWVASGKLVFGYSFQHRRWFILDRIRKAFLQHGGLLYGATGDPGDGSTFGELMNDGADAETASFYYVRTARLYFGAVGILKRLRRVMIRQRQRLDSMTLRLVDLTAEGYGRQMLRATFDQYGLDHKAIQAGMVYEPYAEIYGYGRPGQGLEGLGFDFQPRLAHRPRPALPVRIEDDDPYSFQLVEIPWSCQAGFDEAVIQNRRPYLIFADVEASIDEENPPEALFEDVYVRLTNTAPYFDEATDPDQVMLWTEGVSIPAAKEPNSAPVADFENVDVEFAANRAPTLTLDDVTAEIADPNTLPTVTGSTVPPAVMELNVGEAYLLNFDVEDLEGPNLNVYVLCDGTAAAPFVPTAVYVRALAADGTFDGGNLPVYRYTVTGYDRAFYNVTQGKKKKRVMVDWQPTVRGVYLLTINGDDETGTTSVTFPIEVV